MRTRQVFRPDRPELVVERCGGARLGNCYNATYYKVTSQRALSMGELRLLQAFMDSGQEFMATQVTRDGEKVPVPPTLDWRTRQGIAPSGTDLVPCSEVEEATDRVVRVIEDVKPSAFHFFVYECECRVDSSD